MKTMKKLLLWVALLNKRLFCRPSFVVLLLLMPVSLLLFRSAAEGRGAMVRIALSVPADAGKESLSLTEELTEDVGVVRCILYQTEEEARRAVREGKCDAAWLLPADLPEATRRYAADQTPFLTVVEREDNVAVRLAREKLFGAVYPYLSYALYQRAFSSSPALSGTEEETIRESYLAVASQGELVVFQNVNFSAGVDLLVSPLRGLLSLWVLLAALAAGMYSLSDEERGICMWLPPYKRVLPLFAGCLCAAFDTALVLLLSVRLLGQSLSLSAELLSALVLVLFSAALASLLAVVCRRAAVLCLAAPPLLILLLAASPIFFRTHGSRILTAWNPVTVYLRSLTNPRFLLLGVLSAGSFTVLAFLAFVLSRREQ
ncbi:MAG: hypothetical protein SPJ23_08280 [Eubacteriales bacterium]|nr:hypothetical protein [Eubacteriales bacterium]